jgi:hypothetical protein
MCQTPYKRTSNKILFLVSDTSGKNEAKAIDLSDHYPRAEARGNSEIIWLVNED